jgi:diguanylate cyclase (GGDEF)-like protein/PAS domain S-box-containing protein
MTESGSRGPTAVRPATAIGPTAMARLFDSTHDAVVVTDTAGTIVDANPAYCDMSGFSLSELLGQNPRIAKSGRHTATFYQEMWGSLATAGHWQGEVWDRRKSGELFLKWLSITAIRDVEGRVQGYVGIASDITKRRSDEAELERLAHYDPLTGLANRVLLRDRVTQAIGQARRQSRRLALLMLDLDGFRDVNNALGHAAGDQLLVEAARRITASLRTTDTAARVGGDEFVVLLPEITTSEGVAVVAGNILRAVKQTCLLDQRQVAVSASIGIAVFPDDGEDLEALLACADAALYHVKQHGRGDFHFHSADMHAKTAEQLALESDFLAAFARGELTLFYQPQVEAKSGHLKGFEALLRWPRGSTFVPPSLFLPILERAHQMTTLDEWVLHTAARQMRAWAGQGGAGLRVAVNLSTQQFELPRLAERVAGILMEEGADPRQLEVEITEGAALHNPEQVAATLMDLKNLNIRIALDDFGTGYSSLSYLRTLPLDCLKIDRSFVRDLTSDPQGAALVQSIIGIGHSLGLEVTAEGVETEQQRLGLVEMGCDELQGFLLGRPSPPETWAATLRR